MHINILSDFQNVKQGIGLEMMQNILSASKLGAESRSYIVFYGCSRFFILDKSVIWVQGSVAARGTFLFLQLLKEFLC